MENLLTRFHSTRTRGGRKGLTAARRGWVVLGGLLVLASTAEAREVVPGERDSPEGARWLSVVPRPADRQPREGAWSLGPEVLVDWGPVGSGERDDLADRLDRTLKPLGRTWRPVGPGERAALGFQADGGTGEGYTLEIGSGGARIGSAGAAGRYYGLVTLAQVLPPIARTVEPVRASAGRFVDAPAYGWRGLMVDSSRHFVPEATLEWVLELMALHKLNRFHWHLTDDQGWRLEIPGWPKLTEVGAWRTEADGRRYGGYYTAADVRRLVAFAARRHITVVPEVDLPGHSSAALAAYPELSATGAPRAVPLDWAVADGVLSLGRRTVTRFTGDVLATLVDLFPGPYIHWGGDEVFRTPWTRNAESLAWMRSVKAATPEEALEEFWNDLARKTQARGRIPLGWDEVVLHNPPPGTVIQWWDDPARGLKALAEGRPTIASWKMTTYLDYPEWDGDGDRAWWMPVQTLASVAAQPFWPPGTPEKAKASLLGVEATLFTERVEPARIGRKLFPRLALVADLAWCGQAQADWPGRIADHRDRLTAWGVGMPPPVR